MTFKEYFMEIWLKKYPTPAAGLALGISSLGILWTLFTPFWAHPILQIITGAIAVALILPVISKFILHPQVFMNEIKHPLVGSVIPTLAMSLMVISKDLYEVFYSISEIIWILAVLLHCWFLVLFVRYQLTSFHIENMVPSWFVPPIGIVVAAVTVPANNGVLHAIAEFIVYFGLIAYLIMLPLMLYRLILHPTVPPHAKPSLAVLAAPASLVITGYLNVVESPNLILLLMLLGVALLMTVSVYIKLSHLLRLPFTPAFSAYTFPLVISATSMVKSSLWVHTVPVFTQGGLESLEAIAVAELVLSSIIVIYILYRYVLYIGTAKHTIV